MCICDFNELKSLCTLSGNTAQCLVLLFFSDIQGMSIMNVIFVFGTVNVNAA